MRLVLFLNLVEMGRFELPSALSPQGDSTVRSYTFDLNPEA